MSSTPLDDSTHDDGHPGGGDFPEAKRIDGRWILLGFPILAFGAGLVGALIVGHRGLFWTFAGLSGFWAMYLVALEFVHRK